MTTTMTRPERTSTNSRAPMNPSDMERMLQAAIETLTPTASAPEWAKPESLRNIGNGFGGPY